MTKLTDKKERFKVMKTTTKDLRQEIRHHLRTIKKLRKKPGMTKTRAM